MTALLTPPSASTPERPEPEGTEPLHLVRVTANLLPDEVVGARRLSRLKRRLGLSIVGLIALLGLAYGYSWWQTGEARDQLATEQFNASQMSRQLQRYAPLLQAQAKTTAIQGQLATVMAGDLQWSKLIASLNKAANGRVTLGALTGEVDPTAGTAGSSATSPLATSGQQMVGTLTLSGLAPDYRSVAAFVDALSKVKGLAVVNPGSVSRTDKVVDFTVDLSLTSDALGGRFTAKPASAAPIPGGK
jgi:Tfp pilus assembly protein PilN